MSNLLLLKKAIEFVFVLQDCYAKYSNDSREIYFLKRLKDMIFKFRKYFVEDGHVYNTNGKTPLVFLNIKRMLFNKLFRYGSSIEEIVKYKSEDIFYTNSKREMKLEKEAEEALGELNFHFYTKNSLDMFLECKKNDEDFEVEFDFQMILNEKKELRDKAKDFPKSLIIGQKEGTPLIDLGLSKRCFSSLYKNGIRTIEESKNISKEEYLKNFRDIGEKLYKELEEKISTLSLDTLH